MTVALLAFFLGVVVVTLLFALCAIAANVNAINALKVRCACLEQQHIALQDATSRGVAIISAKLDEASKRLDFRDASNVPQTRTTKTN